MYAIGYSERIRNFVLVKCNSRHEEVLVLDRGALLGTGSLIKTQQKIFHTALLMAVSSSLSTPDTLSAADLTAASMS